MKNYIKYNHFKLYSSIPIYIYIVLRKRLNRNSAITTLIDVANPPPQYTPRRKINRQPIPVKKVVNSS